MKQNLNLMEEINMALDNNLPISKIYLASKDTIQSACRSHFGRTYKGEKIYRLSVQILKRIAQGNKTSSIINALYLEESTFFRFCEHFISPIRILKKLDLGGKNMDSIYAEILKCLIGKNSYMTALQIAQAITRSKDEVREAIAHMRSQGVKIVSRPGYKNSGYKLNDTARIASSEAWINRVRMNRYGLPGNFQY